MIPLSTRLYKIYVTVVATIFIGGAAYTSYTQSDAFPFAAFMMYSDTQDANDLYLLKSFCHRKDGSIIAVSEFDTWAQEGDYFQSIHQAATLPLTAENLQRCEREISRLLNDLSIEGCQKITLRRYYWRKFSGPLALTPEKDEFVCAVGASSGP